MCLRACARAWAWAAADNGAEMNDPDRDCNLEALRWPGTGNTMERERERGREGFELEKKPFSLLFTLFLCLYIKDNSTKRKTDSN